jgi:hypothetical protein
VVLVVSAAVFLGETAAKMVSERSDEKITRPKSTGASSANNRSLYYGEINFKCDLLEALKTPPQLVVMGGSRAQRFEPDFIRRLTGLSAFNFALQNGRPEDAYATSKYLFSRAPDVKLRCFYAIQATTFGDKPMNPGLLYDERFSQWFPPDLVSRQEELNGPPKLVHIPSQRYSPTGLLLHNSYDEMLARGRTQERALRIYIADLLPRAAASGATQTRSRHYFEMLLRLYNDHGVTPAIVMMPYHPLVLEAFREVGWQAKNDALLAYLRELQQTYDLHILDYTEIESFGGDPRFFYDGAHVMKGNARLILEQAVKDAPECF